MSDRSRVMYAYTGLVVMIVASLLVLPEAAGAPTEDPGDQARDILEKGGYQQELPNLDASGERPEESNQAEGNQQQDVTDAGGSDSDFGGLVGGVIEALMWFGVLVACLGAGYLLVRVFAQGRKAPEQESDSIDEADVVEEQDIDRSGMDETLSDADELAREGRYTDAIRRMFLDVTDRVERDLNVSLSKSDTNHEYLERIPGTGNLRELCGKLVRAIDRFYYGGQPCEEADYRRCRAIWKNVQSQSGSGGSA